MNTTFPDHLRTLGEQLDDAWDRRYGTFARRPRLRRLQAAIVVVALVAGVSAIVALLAPTSGPGAVEQALAAAGKSPADTIVHFTSVTRDANGVLLERAERWAATSPPYASRWILEAADAPAIEQGAIGNDYTQYDPAGIVYVRTIAGGIAEGTHPPDFTADAGQVKRYLRDDDTRDAGEVAVDGTTVHRFIVAPRTGGTCTYDVQPDTFYGVSLTCTSLPGGNSSLQQWEYLPRAGNERLLSVLAQHPTARIDRGPLGPCDDSRHTPSTPPCVAVSPGG